MRAEFLKDQGLDYGFVGEPNNGTAASSKMLEAIRKELGDCTRCKLWKNRRKIVFGAGNPNARILFVGEGPGAEEDATGIPFVGKSGKLLTDIITKGMGLTREQVYIANIIKCRPPGNRNPEPDEAAACMPFLEAQIDAVAPEIIVALGKIAAQNFLGREIKITRERGRWREFKGIPLMLTFHPSYLLRNPAGAKQQAWEDIQAVMERLGIPIPSKKLHP